MRQQLMELFQTSTNDLSIEVIITRLAVSMVIAGFIFLSYRLSHDGSIYSKKFNVSHGSPDGNYHHGNDRDRQ